MPIIFLTIVMNSITKSKKGKKKNKINKEQKRKE